MPLSCHNPTIPQSIIHNSTVARADGEVPLLGYLPAAAMRAGLQSESLPGTVAKARISPYPPGGDRVPQWKFSYSGVLQNSRGMSGYIRQLPLPEREEPSKEPPSSSQRPDGLSRRRAHGPRTMSWPATVRLQYGVHTVMVPLAAAALVPASLQGPANKGQTVITGVRNTTQTNAPSRIVQYGREGRSTTPSNQTGRASGCSSEIRSPGQSVWRRWKRPSPPSPTSALDPKILGAIWPPFSARRRSQQPQKPAAGQRQTRQKIHCDVRPFSTARAPANSAPPAGPKALHLSAAPTGPTHGVLGLEMWPKVRYRAVRPRWKPGGRTASLRRQGGRQTDKVAPISAQTNQPANPPSPLSSALLACIAALYALRATQPYRSVSARGRLPTVRNDSSHWLRGDASGGPRLPLGCLVSMGILRSHG
ncbi:hypothetical protein BGZ61DRAFT_577552 [Ilyonectria robusta]|uniref:uncharacterized protein n=1 Tax=Ilyonectria robusta TaxID=1079257 RepID=UPI001E8ED722|nr:uncharacterized protein BGZ61DRAFT_577552 [Ilyonectria robusta]KAH8699992.1 hypothetical protein BGZ61DRAFT_577552 [Ilyonectria robusta]